MPEGGLLYLFSTSQFCRLCCNLTWFGVYKILFRSTLLQKTCQNGEGTSSLSTFVPAILNLGCTLESPGEFSYPHVQAILQANCIGFSGSRVWAPVHFTLPGPLLETRMWQAVGITCLPRTNSSIKKPCEKKADRVCGNWRANTVSGTSTSTKRWREGGRLTERPAPVANPLRFKRGSALSCANLSEWLLYAWFSC